MSYSKKSPNLTTGVPIMFQRISMIALFVGAGIYVAGDLYGIVRLRAAKKEG